MRTGKGSTKGRKQFAIRMLPQTRDKLREYAALTKLSEGFIMDIVVDRFTRHGTPLLAKLKLLDKGVVVLIETPPVGLFTGTVLVETELLSLKRYSQPVILTFPVELANVPTGDLENEVMARLDTILGIVKGLTGGTDG